MAYNFLPCDRNQAYLLPPSLTDWLPEGHLAWFVLDAIEQIDLQPFYKKYRTDGVGNSAFNPSMMVGLLMYAYCTGERSSRRIERLCQTDVAYKVVAANRTLEDLEREVEKILAEADAKDAEEDELYGKDKSGDKLPEDLSATELMELKLRTGRGRELYKLRGQTVEPVFGQIKDARGIDKFMRRGLLELIKGPFGPDGPRILGVLSPNGDLKN